MPVTGKGIPMLWESRPVPAIKAGADLRKTGLEL